MYTEHMLGETSRRMLWHNWTASSLVSRAANVVWNAFQTINRRIPEGELPAPKWASGKLLKSYKRSAPPLGFPRTTDSLCPRCVPEVRNAIINGKADFSSFMWGHSGEIKAQMVEQNGRIIMQKHCEKHGTFEDILSTNPTFTRRIENLFFGRDFRCADDAQVHRHGNSTIQYGRGAVLTVDLTNRCNMMCNPCFMDANQVGYVHELTWEDIKEILDNAISIKPRRQLSVQFSGGEPTISPYFLDAVAYAKKLGYQSTQAASNGIRFAQEPEFARKAKQAGLRLVYLQ